jgi:putative restriction endonuclease
LRRGGRAGGAHRAYLGPKSNDVTNGLRHRADLHTLFDLGLIGVDPDGRTVDLHERLRGTEYEALRGRAIRRPVPEAAAASTEALRRHLRDSGLALR